MFLNLDVSERWELFLVKEATLEEGDLYSVLMDTIWMAQRAVLHKDVKVR